MGVRIHAYALDIPWFDALLDSSLADLLCRYVRDGVVPNERVTVTDRDTDDTYVATAHGSIRAATTTEAGRLYSTLTEADLGRFPILQRSARQHLSQNSIYSLYWLLQGFSRCAGIEFIHRLLDGERRWWIGSLLGSAESASIHDGATNRRFVDLFRKVLRGYDCGYPIPAGDVGVSTDGLPFTPQDDLDLRIGRWCEKECRFAAALLSDILSSLPRFTMPPGPVGIAPDESEWHEWVHRNVASLLEMGDLEYDNLNVLTFIG